MKIEGVPEGYELVRIGKPNVGDVYIGADGGVVTATDCGRAAHDYAILRKLEPSYAERQAVWVKEHDVKVGDKVKVLREIGDRKDGWPNCWSPGTNACVGHALVVNRIDDADIRLEIPTIVYPHARHQNFPYFVLEKVTPKTRPMTRDEFLEAWKQRGFCPLVDDQGISKTITRVEQITGGDHRIIRFENFYVSLSEITSYKFASDDSPLTITE